ncbi:MAG: hypothetical protein MPJ24_10910 [Pirellulaceae bacterium]|nr:hypothetical protein [Pirellulaceae bacterium]
MKQTTSLPRQKESKGKRGCLWSIFLFILLPLGCTFLLGIWIVSASQYVGREFDSDRFEVTQFSYTQLPFSEEPLYRVNRNDTTYFSPEISIENIRRHFSAQGYFAWVGPKPTEMRQDLVLFTPKQGSGSRSFYYYYRGMESYTPQTGAAVLLKYLSSEIYYVNGLESDPVDDWSARYPDRSDLLWPIIVHMAREGRYYDMGDFFAIIPQKLTFDDFKKKLLEIAQRESERSQEEFANAKSEGELQWQEYSEKGWATLIQAIKESPAVEREVDIDLDD